MEYCCDVSCLRMSVDREESIARKNKGITLVQWDNCLQNSSNIKNQKKYAIVLRNFQCHTTSASRSNGRLAGWLAGRLADKIQVHM